ncbi:HEAT repeat domain-containing protein [Rugosimonospora acidiphila]|uniref:HEAT repeat domain-containing protein n=1 Tax=Rugosimonospora acidiphila TaxID=556531 RepID=A0ABP9SBC9_9ACTN
MPTLQTDPAAQTRRCAVALFDGDEFLGSGFFIQRGVVLTCAHVVWGRPEQLTVRWGELRIPGRVIARDPERPDPGQTHYPFPDLCFVKVSEAVNHPYAPLPDSPITPSEVDAYGFSEYSPDESVGQETLRLDVTGFSGRYLRLKNDRVPPGMSGSAIVDPSTGIVYGILKASRDYEQQQGGYMVGATSIFEALRRHATTLDLRSPLEQPLRRPGAPWLRELLAAQSHAADRFPYRLVDGNMPPLSEVYVRLRARARSSGEVPGPLGETLPVARPVTGRPATDILTRHRHALVIAGPGAGKTTLLQNIAGNTAANWLTGGDEPPPFGRVVAVRVPAVALTTRRPWRQALAQAVTADLRGLIDHPLSPELFDSRPMPGVTWLILVDGLDEILDADRRRELIDTLALRMGGYDQDFRYLVTSRPLPLGELERLGAHVPRHETDRLGDYLLNPLDTMDLRRFAVRWFRARRPRETDEFTADFLRKVDGSELAPLLQSPLLATITAVVYEYNPDAPLPEDRTGIYRKFVDYLMHDRQDRLRLAEQLRDRLSGRLTDEQITEFLYRDTETCLEHLADRRLCADELPSIPGAVGYLRAHRAWLGAVRNLDDHVSGLLTSTGLLVPVRDRLDFIHQSFAEYLAAAPASEAPRFSWRAWARTARRDGGVRSLAMFTLARAVGRDFDPLPLLRRLLMPRWNLRHTGVPIVSAILSDGMPLGTDGGQRFFSTALRLLRLRPAFPLGGFIERDLPEVVGWLLARSPRPDELFRLASSRWVSTPKRLGIAAVLADSAIDTVAEHGRQALRRLATHGRLDYRVAACAVLAEQDSETDGELISRVLRDALIDHRRTEARSSALALLNELGQGRLAVLTLLSVALDPTRGRRARHGALGLLAFASSRNLNRSDATVESLEPRLRHTFSGPPLANTWMGDVVADNRRAFVDRLAAAIATYYPLDEWRLGRALVLLMRDPSNSPTDRLRVGNLLGARADERVARLALGTLATDEHLGRTGQLAAARSLERLGDVGQRERLLARWRERSGRRGRLGRADLDD